MSSPPAGLRSDSEADKPNFNSEEIAQQSETKSSASLKRPRVDSFSRLPGFRAKYPPLTDERSKQGLDPSALERYRALDTLASTVFQTGLAAFIGGVAIALTVHSIPFQITIGVLSVFPFCCACTAGLAMLEIDHKNAEHPSFGDLRKKRTSVESSAFWLVCSILFALLAILGVLALTKKLDDAVRSQNTNLVQAKPERGTQADKHSDPKHSMGRRAAQHQDTSIPPR